MQEKFPRAKEVIFTGPTREFVARGEGVSDQRNLIDYEEVAKKDIENPMVFEQIIDRLSVKFPDEPLEILEAGCGYGFALDDIKRKVRSRGLEARTTGATLDEKHSSTTGKTRDQIDELIIGSVQQHFKEGKFTTRFHFIFDFFGAIFFDRNGTQLIPIYSQLLVPGGELIYVDMMLDPRIWGDSHSGIAKHSGIRNEALARLKTNGLRTIEQRGRIVMAEKLDQPITT